jgi:hypothetical protein
MCAEPRGGRLHILLSVFGTARQKNSTADRNRIFGKR